MFPGDTKAQLETIGMLKVVQHLRIGWYPGPGYLRSGSLFGEKVALHLPHLAELYLLYLQDGELGLSCPKMAKAWIQDTKSLCIRVEAASLKFLLLEDCIGTELAATPPKDRSLLQNLTSLIVTRCYEPGRHIIEDVDEIPHLEVLIYQGFPAARMPKSFPRNLERINLYPLVWHCDLPEGLKELDRLEVFVFNTDFGSWKIKRLWAEMLPTHNLQSVKLGSLKYRRQESGGRVSFERYWSDCDDPHRMEVENAPRLDEVYPL